MPPTSLKRKRDDATAASTTSATTFVELAKELSLQIPTKQKALFDSMVAIFPSSGSPAEKKERAAALVWAMHAATDPSLWEAITDKAMQATLLSLYATKALKPGQEWYHYLLPTVQLHVQTPTSSPVKVSSSSRAADNVAAAAGGAPGGGVARRRLPLAATTASNPVIVPPTIDITASPGAASGPSGGTGGTAVDAAMGPPSTAALASVAGPSLEAIRARLQPWMREQLYIYAQYPQARQNSVVTMLKDMTKPSFRDVVHTWPLWSHLIDFARAVADGSLDTARDGDLLLYGSKWRSTDPAASSTTEREAYLASAAKMADRWAQMRAQAEQGADIASYHLTAAKIFVMDVYTARAESARRHLTATDPITQGILAAIEAQVAGAQALIGHYESRVLEEARPVDARTTETRAGTTALVNLYWLSLYGPFMAFHAAQGHWHVGSSAAVAAALASSDPLLASLGAQAKSLAVAARARAAARTESAGAAAPAPLPAPVLVGTPVAAAKSPTPTIKAEHGYTGAVPPPGFVMPAGSSGSGFPWDSLAIPSAVDILGPALGWHIPKNACRICKGAHCVFECPRQWARLLGTPMPGYDANGERDPAAWKHADLVPEARAAWAAFLAARPLLVPPRSANGRRPAF